MVCAIISAVTLFIGVFYLILSYNVLVGWVQILLGLLSLGLCIALKATSKKDSEAKQ